MRRAEETVDGNRTHLAHLGGFQDVLDGGRRQHMVAEHAEVPESLGLRLPDRHGGRRRGGLEADGEEHHLPAGVFLCDAQRIPDGIHHADIRARRLDLEQTPAPAGRHPQHIPVGAQNDVMLFHQRDGIVDAPDRQHADRATGAVHELHIGRHQVLHAVTENRVGVSAAEFHEMVAAIRFDGFPDRGRQLMRQIVLAEFLDVFHAGSPAVSPASANSRKVRSASSSLSLLSA